MKGYRRSLSNLVELEDEWEKQAESRGAKLIETYTRKLKSVQKRKGSEPTVDQKWSQYQG